MKTITIEIPDGKETKWVDGVLTLVDEQPKEITEAVLAAVQKYSMYVDPDNAIAPGDKLSDYGLDSLDCLEMQMELEKQFGIQNTANDIYTTPNTSVRKLIKKIAKRIP